MDFSVSPWHQISERTYMATCQPGGVNVGLVVGDDHALLVDSGSHPRQGAAIASSAASLVSVPVDHLVITHSHWDHWGGLAGVQAKVSIGHEALAELAHDEHVVAEAAAWGVDELVPPSTLISLVHGIDLGGLWVEVLHFGPAHTTTDVMVHVPSESVVFTGDLIEVAGDPQFDRLSQISTWPQALDGILGATNDQTRFVPGHGPITDRMYVFQQRAALSMIDAETQRLARQGIGAEAALEATPWPFSTDTMSVALPLIYQRLAAKGIHPQRQLRLI